MGGMGGRCSRDGRARGPTQAVIIVYCGGLASLPRRGMPIASNCFVGRLRTRPDGALAVGVGEGGILVAVHLMGLNIQRW